MIDPDGMPDHGTNWGHEMMEVADLLLEAFQAAGADDGLIYVSVPITSGRRELTLMAQLSCTRDELRTEHRQRWLEEVVRPNESEAITYAARVRALFPQQLVVEPARLHVSAWSQADYGAFWETLIRKFALRLVATPDWAFSSGARQEVAVALEIGLPILDIQGQPLDLEDLARADADARKLARELGFSEREVAEYLPTLPLEAPAARPPDATQLEAARREAQVNWALSEVFSWLRGERALQIRHFGAERDDQHTREGLGEGSWWVSQLDRYFGRARELGLETSGGRQALAKFVATAIALLESAVRLYGPLPSPGVPLGQNGEER
jgi:hypothetical protein